MHARRSRPIFLTLLAGLLLACCLLAGCAAPEQETPQISYAELLAMMNRTVDIDLVEAIGTPHWWGAHGGRLWACGSRLHPNELWIGSTLPDGSDLTTLQVTAETTPEIAAYKAELSEEPGLEVTSYQQLHGLAWGPDEQLYTMLYEYVSTRAEGEEFFCTQLELLTLCTVSSDGTLQRGPQLTADEELLGGPLWFAAGRFLFDTTGALWVTSTLFAPLDEGGNLLGTTLLRFDISTGECTAVVPLPEGVTVYDEVLLPNGDLLLTTAPNSQKAICPSSMMTIHCGKNGVPVLNTCAEPDLEKLGRPYVFIQDMDGALGEPLLLQTSLGIILWNPETGEGEPVMTWEDYNVGRADWMHPVFRLSEEQFLMISGTGFYSKLHILTLTDEDALAGRPTVTVSLPATNSEQLQNAIHAYNSTGPEVYVKIELYSDMAAVTAGYDSAEEMLKDQLLTHTASDILILPNTLYAPNLLNKGLYLDLAAYLDADPELAREDLLPGILSACEYDGALPTLIPAFSVWTALGAPDTVGSGNGWNWEEYTTVCAAHPTAVPYYGYGRQYILLYLLQGDAFIDYKAGTARLDTPEFARLLEATAAYPAESNMPNTDPKPVFMNGEALLYRTVQSGFSSLLIWEYIFDGPVAFKGTPAENKSVCNPIIPTLRVAINSDCENPQAAWAFVRTLLLPEYQMAIKDGFPIRQDALEAMAAASMQAGAGPGLPSFYRQADLTESQQAYFEQGLTAAQAEQILELVRSLDTVYVYDFALTDIVWEEADYFYNGVRSAAEAAAIMQNRVQTYLDEQG